MEEIVCDILAEHAAQLVVVFPNGDTVADGSRLFHVHFDAYTGGFGCALEQEQEQPDDRARPIAFINRANLE